MPKVIIKKINSCYNCDYRMLKYKFVEPIEDTDTADLHCGKLQRIVKPEVLTFNMATVPIPAWCPLPEDPDNN